MDYNWPLFDGAHVLIQPKGMTVDQLQEGYYYFLREAYSLTGIARRFRGSPMQLGQGAAHFFRNYMLSRYGMIKTAHAIKRKGTDGVGMQALGDRTGLAIQHGPPAAAPSVPSAALPEVSLPQS
jgi:hypothetical protein